jgi:hypothetical protein
MGCRSTRFMAGKQAAEEVGADLSLDKDMLQSVIRKVSLGSYERRAEVQRAATCEPMGIPRIELPVPEPAR